MNERPTPETDAFSVKFKSVCGSKAWVPTDISRRLERERDEAQEALAATKHYLTKERDDALSQIVQAECRAERFCQERDEAREQLAAAKHFLEKYIAERDEAREAIVGWENKWKCAVDMAAIAENERDFFAGEIKRMQEEIWRLHHVISMQSKILHKHGLEEFII